MATVRAALEVGSKRTFAVALDWPGWSRSGRDEQEAIAALLAYAPRYAAVLARGAVRGFPRRVTSCEVVERLPGGASTDFGAPGEPPSADAEPAARHDVERLAAVVRACWAAFDRAADAAEGVPLSTGPRGGGRQLESIRAHVADADLAYLRRLGGSAPKGADGAAVRDAFVEALGARARGELPDLGPRGGKRWTARFAARYAGWHSLDHAWEIEDRVAVGSTGLRGAPGRS